MKDKVGFLGTLVASICCLGFSVVAAPLTAIGLGFLLNDFILFPLVVVFLLVTLLGLHNGRKRHGDRRPFLLGVVVAVLLIPSFFVSVYLAFPLLLLLLASTIWNTVAVYRTTHASATR
ncbi:MAG: MerC family mercury resistance protein [Acidobacteriota bacterium]